MRVLMLTQTYAPVIGGVERMVEDLSSELARRGHEVVVGTFSEPPAGDCEGPVRVHQLASTVHRVPGMHMDRTRHHAPPAPDPETVLGLRRLIRREQPDVVHAHNWIVYSYLPLAARSEAAFVLSLHDYGLLCATKRFLNRGSVCSGPSPVKCMRCAGDYYGPLKGPPVALGTRLLEPSLRRRVDLFLPVSEAVQHLTRTEGGGTSRVVPNFISELPPSPPPDDPGLAQLPEEPFILYFGDVTVDKGALELLRAYEALEDPPPLVLAGRNYLREAERPGVVAIGPVRHAVAVEALRRSLFTVVPSILPEAFGLVALETAALGKPIVASAIGGLPDIVVDEKTGLLFPAGDSAALAAAMRRLLADESLRSRLGTAARRRVAAFSADAVVPRFEEAYALAGERRRARRSAGG